MVPLYYAAEVAWLGVAKIALGWPLWVASLAVMGWMLLAGHTPLEPGEGPGALEQGEGPDGVGSADPASRPSSAGVASGRLGGRGRSRQAVPSVPRCVHRQATGPLRRAVGVVPRRTPAIACCGAHPPSQRRLRRHGTSTAVRCPQRAAKVSHDHVDHARGAAVRRDVDAPAGVDRGASRPDEVRDVVTEAYERYRTNDRWRGGRLHPRPRGRVAGLVRRQRGRRPGQVVRDRRRRHGVLDPERLEAVRVRAGVPGDRLRARPGAGSASTAPASRSTR